MLYDGDGNRVAKSANGVVTHYLVFSSELITAHEGAMSEVRLFISITLLRASARVGTSSRPCDGLINTGAFDVCPGDMDRT